MPERIVFDARQQVRLEHFEIPPTGPTEVRVRTRCSLMSTGTESIAFNALFAPGTHWASWVRYPFFPGYASLGIVEDVGSEIADVGVGDTVFVGQPHASAFVVEAKSCVRVPKEVEPHEAVWHALASTAFVGARRAGYQLGSSVAIVGAGPIGQMSTRWAAAAGLDRIVVIDAFADRLEYAIAGGATRVVTGSLADRRAEIIDANGGAPPEIVIDCTGNAVVFGAALEIVAFGGRVVVLGDTGIPDDQHLTSDVITRGLTIVGAHASHLQTVLDDGAPVDPFAAFRSTPGTAPEALSAGRRFGRAFHHLIASGRFSLDGLITHRFAPRECEAAYALANAAREATMGILFEW